MATSVPTCSGMVPCDTLVPRANPTWFSRYAGVAWTAPAVRATPARPSTTAPAQRAFFFRPAVVDAIASRFVVTMFPIPSTGSWAGIRPMRTVGCGRKALAEYVPVGRRTPASAPRGFPRSSSLGEHLHTYYEHPWSGGCGGTEPRPQRAVEYMLSAGTWISWCCERIDQLHRGMGRERRGSYR